MDTFVVAFSVVWLALGIYVARLGIRQRQIMLSAAALQASLEQADQLVDRSKIAA